MRIKQSIVVPMFGVLLAGCFTMEPVARAKPEIGAEVVLDLNDAGRAALAPSLGREVGQVHGDLVQRDSDEYILAVTSVQFVNGGSQSLTGEHVPIKSEYTAAYNQNRISAPRTIVFSAAVVGGVGFLIAEALSSPAGNGVGVPVGPPDTGGEKQRSPAGVHLSVSSAAAMKMLRRLVPILARF
jgi:hypothetical protein